jgi:hypothetical protein
MSTKSNRQLAERIQKIPAIYANDVQYSLNNFGLRLTFGELSPVEGEPPEHRVAIFIPSQLVSRIVEGLAAVKVQYEKNMTLIQTKAQQQ